ncbi:MAG: AAA family ATPase [Gammaproteobacteria bacterium]|nr:AAA family ATPase [Gammaproteobacteria bacterium]
MLMSEFIGRKKELQILTKFLRKTTSSLLIVKGRRRVGKSTLVNEFAKMHKLDFLPFSGLPPTLEITAQDQRDEFVTQLGLPNTVVTDWTDAFNLLANRVKTGRRLILLDEISWMAHDDPTFLGKLKNVWDLQLKQNPKLILILCGSVSAWIDKNIMSNTGFIGRISFTLKLEELYLSECSYFWNSSNNSNMVSAYEKFKVLAVTGGIPKYLEEIDPALSAENNIKQLCFNPGGILFNEFEQIFSDLFEKRNNIYRLLLENIIENKFDYATIYKNLGVEKSGLISEYLSDLEKAGFVRRDYTWDIATNKRSKHSHHRISDNYVRFYLKYVRPYKDQIERDSFSNRTLTSLPGWETIMGLQFENLVLANRKLIQNIMGIRAENIIYDNPFFQTKTKRRDGCQIDYLIQTRFNILYLCEIKFSQQPIGKQVIASMQQKIARLKTPKGISHRAILIHVNGVNDAVIDSRYFAQIIDFSELFDSQNRPYQP